MRQSSFSKAASEPAPQRDAPTDLIAWEMLASHLSGVGMTLDPPPPQRFTSGFGNLNYLIYVDGQRAVLRRPPLGPLPPGANDMARESKILSSLWRDFPLAPKCLHFSDDAHIIGAPFFIMEFREGIVIGGDMPPALAGWQDPDGASAGAVLGQHMITTLVALHGIDPASVGLDDLGRPEGFLQRTISGWEKRAELAWQHRRPTALNDILKWLNANQPEDRAPTLIHNDFKLDNFILSADRLAPVALIDWDMGTRGDPLLDLAVLLSYWTEAGDPPGVKRLNQMPTTGHGFSSRAEIAAQYARQSGCDLSDFAFYRVLALLRLAVVFRQLYSRNRDSGAADPRFENFDQLADDLLSFSVDVMRGRIN
mgnify:CR=1 FL=1